MTAASRLCAASTAWMSPVKCRLISSMGTIWARPPPVPPPLMPKSVPVGGIQFLNDRAGDIFRGAGAFSFVIPAPGFEIFIHAGRAILHRKGVDRGLEAVGQHPFHFPALVPGFDLRRDVFPEHDLVPGHQAAASTRSARRASSSPMPTTRT